MTPREPLALALGALARKERSVAEMGEWLRCRGVAEGEAADVIDHLISAGALDDARFAERYAEDKRMISGWGSGRIEAALRDRGVPEAEIRAAVGSEDAELEMERAVELLRSRGVELTDDRGRGRAVGLLSRRGFDSEVCYEAVRRAAQ